MLFFSFCWEEGGLPAGKLFSTIGPSKAMRAFGGLSTRPPPLPGADSDSDVMFRISGQKAADVSMLLECTVLK